MMMSGVRHLRMVSSGVRRSLHGRLVR
jgi:hypothetical protein